MIVMLASDICRALLRLYPARFREANGDSLVIETL
mgnify:CR=1 FL=1